MPHSAALKKHIPRRDADYVLYYRKALGGHARTRSVAPPRSRGRYKVRLQLVQASSDGLFGTIQTLSMNGPCIVMTYRVPEKPA